MDLKKTIEGRVKGINEDLVAFREFIKESSKEGEELQMKLAMKKKSLGEDGDPMEAKEEMLGLQRLFYKVQLVDMNVRHLMSSLSELAVLAGLSGIKVADLDLEPEVLEELKNLSSGPSTLFHSEKGKLAVADKESYDFIMKAFEDNAGKEENIKRSFANFQVK